MVDSDSDTATLERLLPPQKFARTEKTVIVRSRRCALIDGFSIHANVSINKGKREALEKLCRYIGRPPIALSRLNRSADGKVSYRVKHHAPNQPAVLLMTPLELLHKLALLIPPPRVHLMRYHGIWAPNSKLRAKAIPTLKSATSESVSLPAMSPSSELLHELTRPRRLKWAELLKRVFAVDVLTCSCGGTMKVLAFILDVDVARKILDHLSLPTTTPVALPARASPDTQSISVDADLDVDVDVDLALP